MATLSTNHSIVGHATPRAASNARTTGRLYYLDNLRVVLTVWVIAYHVGQAYGPTGGEWLFQEPTEAPLLGPFFAVNRMFGMSLFFLIAGYFMVMACDAKGPRAFLRSRLLRLGLPLLVFALLMIPLQIYVIGPLTTGELGSAWPVDVGHLWFVEHLLIFSVCYALWRLKRSCPPEARTAPARPPEYLSILLFALALAAVSAVVRIWYPIDLWVYPFGFVRVAFADFPRDLSFFVIGALAYRHDWLRTFPTRAGYAWLAIGLVLAGFWYAYELGLRDVAPIGPETMRVVYPIGESVLACGMCIGLLVLFREKANFQGRFAMELAHSQYAAYIFHVPFVLLCQWALVDIALPPLAKFALATLACVPLTFLVSYWLRKPLRI
jgi:glucan biosynthesis protein C